jgi:hypothetical protein
MALSDLDVKAGYAGNGVTLSFAIPFADSYWATDEVVVIQRDADGVETILTEGALQDYTLTGAVPPTTPLPTTVQMNVAPAVGVKIYVVRVLALVQGYTFLGTVIPKSVTAALDKLLARIQQVDEAVDRAPKLDLTSSATTPAMDDPTPSCVLAYSADGLRIENGPTVEEVANAEGYAEDALASSVAAAASAAAAAASAAEALAASGAVNVSGSPGAPNNITAAGGIAFAGTKAHNTYYVQGNGGAIDITKNPQISAPTSVGQRLRLVGCSDVNLLTLEHGTGLDLNGMCILGNKGVLDLEWDGTVWFETGRR